MTTNIFNSSLLCAYTKIGFVNNAYEQVWILISQLKKKKMIISHDKPNTFNFWRDVFWSFSSFYSIVFVRSLWLWLSRGGTQSCGRPPLLRMVGLCMCIIHVILLHTRPFLLLPFIFVRFFIHHSIGILYTLSYFHLLAK